MKNIETPCEIITNSNKGVSCAISNDCVYDLLMASNNETINRRLTEIDQIGLKWETVLKNQGEFKRAFCELDVNKMIAFKDTDHERLFTITALLATV